MLNTTRIVWLVFVLNTVIALLYMVIQGARKKQSYILSRGMIMLLCPVTGVLVYLASYIIGLVLKEQEVDYSNISMSKDKKQFYQKLDKIKESGTLPMEEVLSVSTSKDRRAAMMNLLKMDVNDNLGLIRKAVENDDVETSHYAASALTEALGKFSVQLNEYQVAYDKDRTKLETNREFIDAVVRILDSGALIGVEEKKYQYMLVHIVENMNHYHREELTESDYSHVINALCGVGNVAEAEKWADQSFMDYPQSEQSYLNILLVKYLLNKKEDFEDTMNRLKSSRIPLSQKGLDIVRYWSKPVRR